MTVSNAALVDSIVLDPVNAETRRVWKQALRLMNELEGDWTLVGGLMVQLHAARVDQRNARLTRDVDILANSRARPSETERISARLLELDFVEEVTGGIAGPETGFRFVRGEEIVDVLGPDGTGTPPRTVGKFETIEVPGGTQALGRVERVEVRLDDVVAVVRTPTLLAATLLKARAICVAHRDQDQDDLIVLLKCVDDPIALRESLEGKQRAWLCKAEKPLNLGDPELAERHRSDELDDARAAFRLLLDPRG